MRRGDTTAIEVKIGEMLEEKVLGCVDEVMEENVYIGAPGVNCAPWEGDNM